MSDISLGELNGAYIVADQSAFQSTQDLIQNQNINVLEFWERHELEICVNESSVKELCREQYSGDMFSYHAELNIRDVNSTLNMNDDFNQSETATSITNSNHISANAYVISRNTGSLTLANFEPQGYQISFYELGVSKNKQSILWETTNCYGRMFRKSLKKKNFSDLENIKLTRRLAECGKQCFLYTSDKDEMRQCKAEGLSFLTPLSMLFLMEKDEYIYPQKAVSVFCKWGRGSTSGGWQLGYDSYKEFKLTMVNSN